MPQNTNTEQGVTEDGKQALTIDINEAALQILSILNR